MWLARVGASPLVPGGMQWVGARWRREIMPGGSRGRAGSSGFRCCAATDRCSSHTQGRPDARGGSDRLRDAGADLVGPRRRVRLDGSVDRHSRPCVFRSPRAARRSLVVWPVRANHRISGRQLGHRPDFVGLVGDDRIAVEVELAPKSKGRLDAILRLHRDWLWDKKTNGIVYICGNEEGRRRIERANARVDAMPGNGLRVELLDAIKAQTRAEFDRARAGGDAAAA